LPKVVIELQANTQAAVAQIQQFARAQKDAFDAVRAGNPALVDAQVKISKLTDAKKAATSAAQTWGSALQQLPGPLGGIASQVQSLAGMMTGPAGIAAAMTAAGVAVLGFVNHFADSIEQLDNLSAQTGLAVASLQAFQQAAIEAGESPDALVAGLGKVNAAINDVLTGTKDAGKAFNAIGVDIQQMVQDGASAEQILEATAKALAKIEDPTERAARQMEIFGIKGKAMAVIMDTLAHQSIPEFVDGFRTAGIVTSEEANRMARDFDKSMDSIKRNFKASAQSMAVDMLGLIDVAKKTWTQLVNIYTMGAEAAGKAAAKAMAEAGERPPPQDPGTGGKPRTIATPGPSEADVKKAEEAYEKIALAALKATGRMLDAIEMERAARNKAMDEELGAAEKKYMELIKLPGKAEEAAKLRLEAEQKYQNLGLISEQKYAEDRAAILMKWVTDAMAAIKPLGEEFATLGQKFEAAAFVKKSDDAIKGFESMKAAIVGGDESFKKFGISLADIQGIIDKYTDAQKTAIKEGIDPFTEAEKKKKVAVDEAKKAVEAAQKVSENFEKMAKSGASYTQTSKALRQAWLDGTMTLTQYNAELDKLLVKEKAGTFAKEAMTAATKKQTEADQAAAEEGKALADSIGKLHDLYWDTADAARKSAIERAQAEGRVQTAISLTRNHAIELAEREDALNRQKADDLAALAGDYEAADKIREMSNQATMDKIVVAEREAAQKRLAIEAKLNQERTAHLQAWADEMNRVNDEYIARVEGSFIVFTKKVTQHMQQMQTFVSAVLPPKPGGGIWTVNDVLKMTQAQLDAITAAAKNIPAGNDGGARTKRFQLGGIVPGSGPVPIIAHGGEMVLTRAQQQAMGGGTVNIVNVNGSADVNSVAQAVTRSLGEAARRRTSGAPGLSKPRTSGRGFADVSGTIESAKRVVG
jgi:hypothetical protein